MRKRSTLLMQEGVQRQMNPHPFRLSRSRQPHNAIPSASWWQDGLLTAVVCFFLLGVGGLALFLAYPEKAQHLRTVIGRPTDTPFIADTVTPTDTPSPMLGATAEETLAPSPTVTRTPIPNMVATATPTWVTDRYLPLPVSEKWIEIDISRQVLRAYDGEGLVFSTTISTGRDITQAALGKYRIAQKVAMKLFTGPGYYLPDVPWVIVINPNLMLHGAYWQDSWGAPSNFGSINLNPADAKWLYDWSAPSVPAGQQSIQATAQDQGTWVIIHQ